MISDSDLIITWIVITVFVCGLFLALVRVLRWYRSMNRPDPLEPSGYEYRDVSLRRER